MSYDTLKQKPTTCEYGSGHFKLTQQGLSFIGIDKEGHQLPPRWICSSLRVLAKTRDAKSGAWGRLLEWQDDDGVTHQWAMPIALLQGDAADMRKELANLGLAISPNRAARDLFTGILFASISCRSACALCR